MRGIEGGMEIKARGGFTRNWNGRGRMGTKEIPVKPHTTSPTAIDTNSTLANNTAWLATNLLQMYLSKYANGANFLGDNVGISIIFVKVRTATSMRIPMVGKASC